MCCCFWFRNVAMLHALLQVLLFKPNGGMADLPQAMTTVWAHRGAHTPAVGPPVRPRGPQGRHEPNHLPLTPFLLLFSLCVLAEVEEQAAIAAAALPCSHTTITVPLPKIHCTELRHHLL
jgi:hypothetical protein